MSIQYLVLVSLNHETRAQSHKDIFSVKLRYSGF